MAEIDTKEPEKKQDNNMQELLENFLLFETKKEESIRNLLFDKRFEINGEQKNFEEFKKANIKKVPKSISKKYEKKNQELLENFVIQYDFLFTEEELSNLTKDSLEKSKEQNFINTKTELFEEIEKRIIEKKQNLEKKRKEKELLPEEQNELTTLKILLTELKYKKQILEVESFTLENIEPKIQKQIENFKKIKTPFDELNDAISIIENFKDINEEKSIIKSETTKNFFLLELKTQFETENINSIIEEYLTKLKEKKDLIKENYSANNSTQNSLPKIFISNRYQNKLTAELKEYKIDKNIDKVSQLYKDNFLKYQFQTTNIPILRKNSVLTQTLLTLLEQNELFKIDIRPFSKSNTILQEIIQSKIDENNSLIGNKLKTETKIVKNINDAKQSNVIEISIDEQNKLIQSLEFKILSNMQKTSEKLASCLSETETKDECENIFKNLNIVKDANTKLKDCLKKYYETYGTTLENKVLEKIKIDENGKIEEFDTVFNYITTIKSNDDIEKLNKQIEQLFGKENFCDEYHIELKTKLELENNESNLIKKIQENFILEILGNGISNNNFQQVLDSLKNPEIVKKYNEQLKKIFINNGIMKEKIDENPTTFILDEISTPEIVNKAIESLSHTNHPKSKQFDKILKEIEKRSSINKNEEEIYFSNLIKHYQSKLSTDLSKEEIETIKKEMEETIKKTCSDSLLTFNDVKQIVNTTINKSISTIPELEKHKRNVASTSVGENLETSYSIPFKQLSTFDGIKHIANYIEFSNYVNYAGDHTDKNELMRIFFEQDPSIMAVQAEDNKKFLLNMRSLPKEDILYASLGDGSNIEFFDNLNKNIISVIQENQSKEPLSNDELKQIIIGELLEKGIITKEMSNNINFIENSPYIKNYLPILEMQRDKNEQLKSFLSIVYKELENSKEEITPENIKKLLKDEKILKLLKNDDYKKIFFENGEIKNELVEDIHKLFLTEPKDNFEKDLNSFFYEQSLLSKHKLDKDKITSKLKVMDSAIIPDILQSEIKSLAYNSYFLPLSNEDSLNAIIKTAVMHQDNNNLYIDTKPISIRTKIDQLAQMSIPYPNTKGIDVREIAKDIERKYFNRFKNDYNATLEERTAYLIEEEKNIKNQKLKSLTSDLSKKQHKQMKATLDEEMKASKHRFDQVMGEIYQNPINFINPFVFLKALLEEFKQAFYLAKNYIIKKYFVNEDSIKKQIEKSIIQENSFSNATVSETLSNVASTQEILNIVKTFKDEPHYLKSSLNRNLSNTNDGIRFINNITTQLINDRKNVYGESEIVIEEIDKRIDEIKGEQKQKQELQKQISKNNKLLSVIQEQLVRKNDKNNDAQSDKTRSTFSKYIKKFESLIDENVKKVFESNNLDNETIKQLPYFNKMLYKIINSEKKETIEEILNNLTNPNKIKELFQKKDIDLTEEEQKEKKDLIDFKNLPIDKQEILLETLSVKLIELSSIPELEAQKASLYLQNAELRIQKDNIEDRTHELKSLEKEKTKYEKTHELKTFLTDELEIPTTKRSFIIGQIPLKITYDNNANPPILKYGDIEIKDYIEVNKDETSISFNIDGEIITLNKKGEQYELDKEVKFQIQTIQDGTLENIMYQDPILSKMISFPMLSLLSKETLTTEEEIEKEKLLAQINKLNPDIKKHIQIEMENIKIKDLFQKKDGDLTGKEREEKKDFIDAISKLETNKIIELLSKKVPTKEEIEKKEKLLAQINKLNPNIKIKDLFQKKDGDLTGKEREEKKDFIDAISKLETNKIIELLSKKVPTKEEIEKKEKLIDGLKKDNFGYENKKFDEIKITREQMNFFQTIYDKKYSSQIEGDKLKLSKEDIKFLEELYIETFKANEKDIKRPLDIEWKEIIEKSEQYIDYVFAESISKTINILNSNGFDNLNGLSSLDIMQITNIIEERNLGSSTILPEELKTSLGSQFSLNR